MNGVLLVNPLMLAPKEHTSFNALCPPLGLGYLASSLMLKGADVSILDMNISPHPDHELRKALLAKNLFLVGITSVTQNYDAAIATARMVKAVSKDIYVVMGGPHVSYEWKAALTEASIDAVVLFEGEQSIVEIYRRLRAGKRDMTGVAGVAHKAHGEILVNQMQSHETNLDRVPFPARHLLPMHRYGRPGTILTSRGCTAKCIFCISSTYEGNYRPRSADNVVEELDILRNTWGIRDIYFLDNVFTVDAERVRSICQQIIDRRLDIQFHCVSRADLMTVELIKWLKAAGCQRIEIGVESGSQKNITAFKKNITLEQVHNAADIVLGAGLHPMFTFQIGAPSETQETLNETHRLAVALRKKGAITFFSIMTPYPGTPLVKNAKELGIHIRSQNWGDYRTSNPIYDTSHLNRNDIRQALYREIAMGTMLVDQFADDGLVVA